MATAIKAVYAGGEEMNTIKRFYGDDMYDLRRKFDIYCSEHNKNPINVSVAYDSHGRGIIACVVFEEAKR